MASLLDIIKNPATGKVSHSKLWANIACAAATYKFVAAADAPSEIWAIYLGIVGGYAVAMAQSMSVMPGKMTSLRAAMTSTTGALAAAPA